MNERLVTSFDDVADWVVAHERLRELEGFAILARFHLIIDDADVRFWKLANREKAAGIGGKFKTLELTEFGRKAGGDSPRWWVLTQDPDVAALWNDTKIAYLAAQKLVNQSKRIGRRNVSNYGEFIDQLVVFLTQNDRELRVLESYARGLASKNELAPAILFSYSVWGSTRRSDRTLDGQQYDSENARLQLAGELALGLRHRTWPTLYRVWLHALDDAGESADPEDYLSVPMDELFRRAEYDMTRALVEYFTEVRDSLRHIDLLCQEVQHREHIYADDTFVTRLINKIAADPALVESELWDVKEALDMWSCPREQRAAASVVFVEDVAAFANNRGGVLILGITNTTHSIVGISDAENRLKHLETTLRSRIDTSTDFVRARAVPVGARTCIIIVVGQTADPVGVKQVNNTYTYPVRVGPGIERLSRSDVYRRKPHHLKGTSFEFAAELAAWVGL
jgi:Putative DNA-binding domain